ncbi:helix-turn-helix domain-containing protein [Lactococcus lactis]|uniref:helix-turn-helix domain-containing protein n=1 Tax=Lactococcus lactis TaxID=1358 RepID=UPI00288F8396|nr:helix-turn-helix transcriptional regulator [Lactococcus lactis]MDT2862672.1 helix-turn-helix transcriptional regulator [Lactococcus lactis]MDT2870986.1 helix-turn-helix transcriptional regulator [Lactococcus lactis]MDT2873252.1 helix-turn-helix transcriptional regulator [Lactococcus lactis]MDT2876096.1 helix-turn-helix transcriptional regulator [Lactococcus lactis]MDT2886656.1 helix-turn-helix transcriptional regulator [Lactococcus lactis]
MNLEYLGDKLKASRKSKNLTQKELADKIDVKTRTVASYEQGSAYPSIEVLGKICDTLGISSDYLLGISDKIPLEMGGLTDDQMQLFLQLISIVEQYNDTNEKGS